jgi:hypothetical protein
MGYEVDIRSKMDNETHRAEFEPVRKVRDSELGWATVTADDCTLRFPAIVYRGGEWVVTVNDWQAPWFGEIDLANPEGVRELLRTGSGSFVNPATGNKSDIPKHFT